MTNLDDCSIAKFVSQLCQLEGKDSIVKIFSQTFPIKANVALQSLSVQHYGGKGSIVRIFCETF